MGKSKKPFIDKKNSSTYHVLHRSQRDVGGGEGTTTTILWPSPDNLKETDQHVLSSSPSRPPNVLDEWKQQANDAGLLDDYNYDQHLKPITGTGDYLNGATGHVVSQDDALHSFRSTNLLDNSVKEVSRQLESIALTPTCMEEDIAEALFGDFEQNDFEEILDDFVATAAQEPDEEEEEEVFDFDAHIQNLMERAKKKDSDKEGVDMQNHAWGKGDGDFFSKSKPLHQKQEDDDSGHFDESLLLNNFETPGVVPALGVDEERALAKKFEQTLAEYDSDEVGDLDEECQDICGARPLEGDAQVDAALNDFLREKKDDVFMQGTRHLPEYRRQGGSGFSALVGRNMVPAQELAGEMEDKVTQQPEESIQEILAQAKEVLANPEMEPPPEEIFIDGKSYFSERTRNPWDCESILTTYSNLDNNPVTIESSRRRGKNKKGARIAPQCSVPEEDESAQICLSDKTGLPIGVLEESYHDDVDDTFVSINKGVARKKHETVKEKKARKEAVKKERQVARMQKKMLKEAFKEEFMRRSGDIVADDVGGKSVFRYS